MSAVDASGWLAFLEEIADAADPIALRYFRARDLRVEEKPELGPVTPGDLEIEETARRIVSQRHPGLGVFGEEQGETALNAFRAPKGYDQASKRKFRGLTYSSWNSPWQTAQRIAKETGMEIRVEFPLPPYPEIELNQPYHDRLPARAGGGVGPIGGQVGAGFSLPEKLQYSLGVGAVPLIEENAVRLLPPAGAHAFWRGWAGRQQ